MKTLQKLNDLVRILVPRIVVGSRDEMRPTIHLPLVRVNDSKVDSGLHNTNLFDAGSYLVEGLKVTLTERHAKVRRDGYRKQR